MGSRARSIWEGRRTALNDVRASSTTHAGLWLDRYLTLQTVRTELRGHPYDKEAGAAAKQSLIAGVTERPPPPGYRVAFEARRASFDDPDVVTATGTVRGRLAIGVGAKGAGEFGLTLEHTWGVPMLPGSSLKGIAALAADRYFDDPAWRRPSDAPNAWSVLFGDTTHQGAIVFHDAWWIPGSDGDKVPIHQDVLTVHHKEYYEGSKDVPDGRNDPTPVPFVSVSGRYLIALEALPGVPAAWLERAWEALRLGLDRHGVGAKTNAGYGRVNLPVWSETPGGLRVSERAEQARADAEREATRARRAALDPAARLGDVQGREGDDAIRRWLESAGEEALLGLSGEKEEIAAAVGALWRARLAKGLRGACGAWSPVVDAVMDELGGNTTPVRAGKPQPLASGELDRLLSVKKPNLNKIASQLAIRQLSSEDLDRAEKALRDHGAKDGHIRVLRGG